MKTLILIVSILLAVKLNAQNYDSYYTGNTVDAQTNPTGGICLMGGATENDEAMKWFLQRANGGDILVLRASGSDGYNNYFYTQLGVPVNSVETIVFNNAQAANDSYIHQKINQAEAIWFAGGDQWDYISYWRGTAIDSLINLGIQNRNIVIGGTSAGMAIQGKYYFTAENGTITTTDALNNPYHPNLTVDSVSFIQKDYLSDVITDTHYDNPDRKGRHLTFMARVYQDLGTGIKGIACEEYTAVCIDENGIASVYGDHPNYDDFAYFLQPNCEVLDPSPEICSTGIPLTWSHSSEAVKVYKVPGTMNGANTFDLNDWQTGSGGIWQNWSVTPNTLVEAPSIAPNCNLSLLELKRDFIIYPNPLHDELNIEHNFGSFQVEILNLLGQQVLFFENQKKLNLSNLDNGSYIIRIRAHSHIFTKKIIKR